ADLVGALRRHRGAEAVDVIVVRIREHVDARADLDPALLGPGNEPLAALDLLFERLREADAAPFLPLPGEEVRLVEIDRADARHRRAEELHDVETGVGRP